MAVAAGCGLDDRSNGVRTFAAFFTGPLDQTAVSIMLVGIPGDITGGIRVLGCEGEALELAGQNAVPGSDPADFVTIDGYGPAGHSFILLELGAFRHAQVDLCGGNVFFRWYLERIGLPSTCGGFSW
ncbi:hypothetical protein D3C71_1871040 [compost metagenome]